jgi:hypothetical protein
MGQPVAIGDPCVTRKLAVIVPENCSDPISVHGGAGSRAAGASRVACGDQLHVNSRPWPLAWLVQSVSAAMETLLMLVHIGGLGFLGWGAYLAFTQHSADVPQDLEEPVDTRD